jgi:nucleotidyltransferase AbiEii toxin of type IV toxin-antitoxin system
MFDATQPGRQDWVLKGGYALEMRFHKARSTKDLDLTVRTRIDAVQVVGSSSPLRERLQLAASVQLPDFFTFVVGEAMAELNQAPEGGARFPLDARLDGRTFARFHVDLGVGDEILEPLEEVVGEDWLGFAGIPAVSIPALSTEQHWAEKFHAYTRPREAANSRVRDLVDLALIIERRDLSSHRVRAAVDATFARRGTHPVPTDVPPPPADWEKPFAALAAECHMEYTSTTAYRWNTPSRTSSGRERPVPASGRSDKKNSQLSVTDDPSDCCR